MLATLIQRYDKKSFQFKNERQTEILQAVMSGATFYECVINIYQFIKPFLDDKMSIFKEYGAFNKLTCWVKISADDILKYFCSTCVST